MKFAPKFFLFSIVGALAGTQIYAQVPQIVSVTKTDHYVQTSNATPAIDINLVGPPEFSQRYQFSVSISGDSNISGIAAPVVTLAAGSTAPTVIPAGHNGGVLVWNANDENWNYGSGGFNWATNDSAGRDALFAEGVYTVNAIGTSVNLNLANTVFGPNTPQVTLTGGVWAGGKYYVDVSQPLTVTTNEFTNYDQNANGAIDLNVWQANGPDVVSLLAVHSATPLGFPVSPSTKSLTQTIAPGTLIAGRTYSGDVTFSAVVDQVTGAPATAFANSLNIAIRARRMNFTIVAYTGKVPFVSLYGIGDLPGGGTVSSVRDATKVGGVIYAVGGSNAVGGGGVTAATLWTSSAGLVALPDLVANTSTGPIEAFAITSNGSFIASRAHASSVASDRRAVRVTTNGLVNIDLGSSVPVPTTSGVNSVSEDGSVLYGGSLLAVGGKNQVFRFTVSGATVTATPIPFLNQGDDSSGMPIHGASSDGSVMVGTSSSPTAVQNGLGNQAFRYLHGSGVSAVPFLSGGTWNNALAVTPDGNLVLVRGNSTAFPNGEIYIYNATTAAITSLGSPNASAIPGGNARLTTGGSAVACVFGSTAYIRNATGWHTLTSIIAGTGVDLTDWTLANFTFLGMSPDGTLVCGTGFHNGITEGYVLELPSGYLADATPVITSSLTATGTYGQQFDYNITATNQPDDFDALNLPPALSINHATGKISGLLSQAGAFPATIAATNYFGSDIKGLPLTVSPASATVQLSNLLQAYDGFPKVVNVTTTPAGRSTSITYSGSLTAPTNVGSYDVAATITDPNYAGGTTGTLNVTPATATVTISNTNQTYNGVGKSVTVSTTPAGLSTSVTYNGVATLPIVAGSYAVVATSTNTNYSGSASGSLTIVKANASIQLSNLSALYDGNQHAVSVTTNPVGLTVNVLYDGSATAPAGVGAYPVSAVINDPNYSGSANATLTIRDNSVLPTQAAIYGIDDVAGGVFNSEVRDAVRVNNVIYAVGTGTSTNGFQDKPVLWSTTGGLVVLPNLSGITGGVTPAIASAITPGARYIASRARFNTNNPNQRHASRVTVNGLVTQDLGAISIPGFGNPNSATNAISRDGSILYGFGNGLSQAVRYSVSDLTATPIPFLSAGDNNNTPAGRGASADGSVMVGTSSYVDPITGVPLTNHAYRYVHGAGVSAIPYLAGGNWSKALAVSADGNLTMVAGNSSSAPQGEIYLHNATTGAMTSLGTPNGSRSPNNLGGMNSDGSVIAITFNGADNPTKASYIHNSHGWHDFQKIAAAVGIDVSSWTFTNIFGMSQDGTMVWGSGLHNGNNEGFVAEFPVGYLATFDEPVIYSTPGVGIVGAWTVGDTSTTNSAALIFFSNGYYIHMETGSDSGSANGIERGQFTWDAATGAFTCTTLVDTTGDSGLGSINGLAGVTLVLSGDTLTANIPGEPDHTVLSRVIGPSPLVGAWGDATHSDNSAAIVFLPNGYYFMARDGDSTLAGDPSGHDGMEWGTYVWDSLSGVLTATTLVDSNGEWGLSNPDGILTFVVSADLRTLTINGGETIAPRVGLASPIVSLSNLAYTYDGTPHSATVTTVPGGIAATVTYNGSAALPVNAGSYSVVATITNPLYAGSASGTLTIAQATAVVNFTNTTQTYNGSAKSVTVSTTPGGLNTSVTYDGGPAPTLAGSYTVNATVVDANFAGSGSTTLTIGKGTATVDLGNLSLVYDGSPKTIVPTTNPLGLTTSVTYNGSATVPTAAGSYSVVATVNDANYAGTASGTFVVGPASATITLSNTVQAYDGTPRPVSVATNPIGLAVSVLYDNSPTAPTSIGTYPVSVVTNEANYTGSTNGTLTITAAAPDGTPVGSNIIVMPPAVDSNGNPVAGAPVVGLVFSNVLTPGFTKVTVAPTGPGAPSNFAIGTPPVYLDIQTTATFSGLVEITVDYSSLSFGNLAALILGHYVNGAWVDITTTNDTVNHLIHGVTNSFSPFAIFEPVTVTLGGLSQTYTGSGISATATTTPAGLPVGFTYNGSATPPVNAGDYAVVATIDDVRYTVSASGSLHIGKATALVALNNLSQIYDGSPKPVTATTTPSGLTVNFTYNGNATAPTAVGSYAVVATVNHANYQGSTTGTLVIGTAPLQIVTQPVNTTVVAGQTATFTVAATGTGPITYQWRKGTTNIAGATSATLSIPNAQSTDAANYRCVVTNPAGSLTSSIVSLTVLVPPAITVQPVPLTRNSGQNASFTVTATGTATLLYQWRKDGVDIAGATTRTLSLTAVTPANAGVYSVVVSNATGAAYAVTSVDVALTVNVAPAIAIQPVPATVIVGSPATFSVEATGTATLTYQWRKGTTDIPGATSSSYTINSTVTTDAANYRVVVTNAAGSVTSTAVSLTVVMPPAITTQPVDLTRNAGQNASFTVTATGSATLTYQWQFNGTNIVGATAKTLALTAVTSANEGLYRVVVTNAGGSVTSSDARLTVLVKPTIATQPVSVTKSVGGTAIFTVVAAGTAPFDYQWKKGNTNIAGATGPTLTISPLKASDAGNYKVVVTNVAGTITSAVASLTVN